TRCYSRSFHSLGATPVHSTHSVLLLKAAAEVTVVKGSLPSRLPLSKVRRRRRLTAIKDSPLPKTRLRRLCLTLPSPNCRRFYLHC
ncbi:hypothetical protein VIGAN_08173800, partial [Vigna angularis var. angularis]